MKEIDVALLDESSISEINILSDGRICIFGASMQVLEMLDATSLGDLSLRRRIEALRRAQAGPAVESNSLESNMTGSAQSDGAIMNRVE
jgi:hypothetical protein